MIRRHGLNLLWVAASFALLSASCKPKQGARCTAGQVSCADAKTGLFCGADGTFQTMTCDGTDGCKPSGAAVACDNSIAAVNDGCDTPGDAACSADGKSALICTGGVFGVGETCKGPGGCKTSGDTITCDNDISDPGDPCRTLGDYACTSDKAMVLRCDANKMTSLNTCRGPKACGIVPVPSQNKVEFVCDDSIAMEGDACDTNGEEACSVDKKSMYVCTVNKFANPKACSGPNGCTYEEKFDRYACDQGGDSAPVNSNSAGAGGGKKGGKKH
jgi:hypothetical protein